MALWRPSNDGHTAALAFKAWIMANDAEEWTVLDRAFRPLWGTFSKEVINETGTWGNFIHNIDNAVMFWAWVYDKHPVAFWCVARVCDPKMVLPQIALASPPRPARPGRG